MTENVYAVKGFVNRRAYLESLAEDYGVPLEMVFGFAEMLGENEDFDGLVCELEDLSYLGGWE